MKKVTDKIALVILIVIGFVAIVLSIVFPMLGEGWAFGTNDVIFITLAVLYILVSIYLLWSIFSSQGNVKTLTLFADKESSTKTTLKVIKALVVNNAKRVQGAAVKKVRVSQRDNGVRLFVALTIVGAEVEETVDTMRCLVADTFVNVLGIRFDIIDFKVLKVKPQYIASEDKARERAKTIHNERKCSEKYHEEAVDPIFEQAEAERDKAEQELSKSVVEQAQTEGQGEQVEVPPVTKQTTKAKGKRKQKVSKHSEEGQEEVSQEVNTESQAQQETPYYGEDMERVSEEEQQARKQQEQPTNPLPLTDAEVNIKDDGEVD